MLKDTVLIHAIFYARWKQRHIPTGSKPHQVQLGRSPNGCRRADGNRFTDEDEILREGGNLNENTRSGHTKKTRGSLLNSLLFERIQRKRDGKMIDSTITLRPDVVVTVLEDSAVLLELQTKFFYSVNSAGWAIVQMLENGAFVKQIKEQCAAWGAPADDMKKIESFLQVFMDDNLVMSEDGVEHKPEISFEGPWSPPSVEKHKEPLQRVMVSAFDPSLPLAE